MLALALVLAEQEQAIAHLHTQGQGRKYSSAGLQLCLGIPPFDEDVVYLNGGDRGYERCLPYVRRPSMARARRAARWSSTRIGYGPRP